MQDPAKVSRLLIESAAALAQATHARAIIVAVDGLPDVDAVPPRTVLVTREPADRERAARLEVDEKRVIEVPNVELDRLGQVKLSAIIALSSRIIGLHDHVVFLTGPFRSLIDSIVVMPIGAEYELLDTTKQPAIDEHIKRAVFYRVLELALNIGYHGREGRKIGALLVVGDTNAVQENSEQMILNPFKGYDEKDRNILDDVMLETLKEYSIIDGAIVIRGNGVVESAGTRIRVGQSVGLPPGLGARHAAAAGITAATGAIAVSVSESDGTVRVWRNGRMVAALEPTPR